MLCRCGNPDVVARGLCNACYLAFRKRARREGRWPVALVDAAPAAKHLELLEQAGLSRRQVAALTGLHRTTVYRLAPGTRVLRETVATVLSVRPPQGEQVVVQGRVYVCAVGATRRLQALCALGWPTAQLADRLGMASARSHVCELARGEHERVLQRTAQNIAALYDRLGMSPGPSERVRCDAQRKGWAPPLAWDDDHLDDPAAQPQGVGQQRRLSFPERYRELRALGYSNEDEIAWRLGISRRSLNRMLTPSRHGREVPA